MKLRWIEREIEVVTIDSGCYTQTERFLQYWSPINDSDDGGNWIDVPLGFEELDK